MSVSRVFKLIMLVMLMFSIIVVLMFSIIVVLVVLMVMTEWACNKFFGGDVS